MRRTVPHQQIDRDAFTIEEFCSRHGISKSAYFKLQAAGEGPRVMRVSLRGVRISREAAAEWRRDRENATSERRSA